jgi:hypothetical protein
VDKYAGVTLDYFDDKGALIKEKFPQVDQLPDVIKTANVKPQEQLPDEAFALVALDGGHVLRKFACVDPGTTAMSVMYFMENCDKLPEGAVKTAARNLFEACTQHKLVPPVELTKMAGWLTSEKGDQFEQALRAHRAAGKDPSTMTKADIERYVGKNKKVVDITGQSPKSKTAAAPTSDEDYAVVTSDGQRMYPIHDWDHIKQACDYWAIEARRQFAVKLAAKAHGFGYPIDDETLLDAGAVDYADEDHVKTAMDMRKMTLPGEDNAVHRGFLDELLEKKASMHPEIFAECVRRFDVMNEIDPGWDSIILSPWESTFGLEKTAKVVWESGADRVTEEALVNLARNRSGELQEEWNHDITQGMFSDPVGTFNSLPLPHKKVMARLANDVSSQGGSVMESENEGMPK